LAAVSLALGLGAEGFAQVALQAADRVLDQQGYAQAVLAFLGKSTGVATP
jgi:hypothetical protein